MSSIITNLTIRNLFQMNLSSNEVNNLKPLGSNISSVNGQKKAQLTPKLMKRIQQTIETSRNSDKAKQLEKIRFFSRLQEMQGAAPLQYADIKHARFTNILTNKEYCDNEILQISKLNVKNHNLGLAMQYPQKESLEELFNYVADNKINLIHNLASDDDIAKPKNNLPEYFNFEGKCTYGGVSVECLEKKQHQTGGLNHTEYKLEITKSDGTKALVTVLHTKNWKDFGAVDVGDLKEIINLRKQLHGGKAEKTITHCRAGVGRTGTVISSEAMTQYADLSAESAILGLRKCRNNKMVQTEKQAQLVFDLGESLKKGETKKLKSISNRSRAEPLHYADTNKNILTENNQVLDRPKGLTSELNQKELNQKVLFELELEKEKLTGYLAHFGIKAKGTNEDIITQGEDLLNDLNDLYQEI